MNTKHEQAAASGKTFKSMEDFERRFYPATASKPKKEEDARAAGTRLARLSLVRITHRSTGK